LHQQLGSFTIEACVRHGAYRLALPPQLWCLHPVFLVIKLSLVLPDLIQDYWPAPLLPILLNGEDEYKVKAILDSQTRYNCLKYLVKWKGYDDSHNSWQMHHQFHVQAKVVKFHHKNPGAAHHINAAIFDSISFTHADLATTWRFSCVMTLCLWKGMI
jgi:hypothetical protein